MRVDQFEQFVVHRFSLIFFPASQSFGGAMMQMIFHQVARHAAQRLLHGGNLHNDVRAVAVLFHHFLQAAHLAFDAAKTILIGLFQQRIDTEGLASTSRGIARAIGQRRMVALSRTPVRMPCSLQRHDTLPPYLIPPTSIRCQSPLRLGTTGFPPPPLLPPSLPMLY